jgi:zinc transporter ZupT
MVFWASLIAAIVLATIHLLASRMRFLHVIPRSRWLSIAGGASVAYVILHLLPELSRHQNVIAERLGEHLAYLEYHIYILCLAGLTTFYGLERLAVRSRRHHRRTAGEDRPGRLVFWIHIGSFALYNLLIGYLLLHLESPGLLPLILFALAMGLHFIVNDYGLEEHHRQAYRRQGRWLLTLAILAGWLLGATAPVPLFWVSILLGFLAGGVILNVLKEELPEERESRFWAFAAGAAIYSLILLAI